MVNVMKHNKTIELLAPAGSWEALEAAVNAGADAVYMGGKAFGARQYASNFDREELTRAVYFAHMHRVRLYITVNTLVPQLPLHASTQMTVTSLAGVRLCAENGMERAVLARELSIKDIKTICSNTDTEIEVFIHGALCVCYSGQCLMSSLIGGRSGNRGRCAQDAAATAGAVRSPAACRISLPTKTAGTCWQVLTPGNIF